MNMEEAFRREFNAFGNQYQAVLVHTKVGTEYVDTICLIFIRDSLGWDLPHPVYEKRGIAVTTAQLERCISEFLRNNARPGGVELELDFGTEDVS